MPKNVTDFSILGDNIMEIAFFCDINYLQNQFTSTGFFLNSDALQTIKVSLLFIMLPTLLLKGTSGVLFN